MTAQRAGNAQWLATTVLIRADILSRATDARIDISSECNRALARMLGIDYSQQKIPELPSIKPVIVACEPVEKTVRLDTGGGKRPVRPVLNAEDPQAPAHILKMRNDSAPVHPVPHHPEGKDTKAIGGHEIPSPLDPALHKGGKQQKKHLHKKGSDDMIREFVTRKIIRTDSGGETSRIAKDELYQVFLRWSKTNRSGGKAPDRRSFGIALKNRFVMEDTVEDGTPYWMNVRLR